MKKMLTIFTVMLTLSSVVFGLGWNFDRVLTSFPDLDVADAYGMHGVAVDGNGMIWYSMYNITTNTYIVGTDTTETRGIHIVNTAGVAAAFSPIDIITVGSVTDTLTSSSRGITTAHDGNILVALSNGILYKINSSTGAGMAKYDYGTAAGLTKAAVDAAGNVYVGRVSSGHPVNMLNSDLVFQAEVIAAFPKISRAIVASADGKDLYFGTTWTGGGILKYHSELPGVVPHAPDATLPAIGNWEPEGVFDTTIVTLFDTLIVNTDTTITAYEDTTIAQHVIYQWPEDVSMGPDGYIYSANTQSSFSGDTVHGSFYYAYDTDGTEMFSFGTPPADILDVTAASAATARDAGGIWNGRGCAWNADGTEMYVADFGYNAITVWTLNTDAVSDEPISLPNAFELKQNFPNPFNPSTSIAYNLHQNGFVKLTVFDLTGREVAILVNEQLNAGSHLATFNGENLSSGLYIYQLSFNGAVSAKNMMLIK